jgi:hypothetical protein
MRRRMRRREPGASARVSTGSAVVRLAEKANSCGRHRESRELFDSPARRFPNRAGCTESIPAASTWHRVWHRLRSRAMG